MSSVELDGRWYKRCMGGCGEFIDYEDLVYQPPSPEHPYGLDVCGPCAQPGAVEATFVTLNLPEGGDR